MNSEQLKSHFKSRNQEFSDELNIRVHRSIQWLKRSEMEGEDLDAKFIFLWISFNAAYAELFGIENSERRNLKLFFERLVSVDGEERIHRLIFEEFTGVIRTLIQNKFVFDPFWKAMREHDNSGIWEKQFEDSKTLAMTALLNHDTVNALTVVFDRLYILRNQLVHGGATWNSKVNRQQVKDGADFMNKFVPLMIQIMIEHHEKDWGEIIYPVV